MAKAATASPPKSERDKRVEDMHAASKIVQVPLDNIQVDRSYQRDLSMRLVDEIADNWDEVASELTLVSDRGQRPEKGEVKGGLFIVNGQHRTAAARKLQKKKIWARLIDLSAEKDPAAIEASLRLKTNVRMGDRPLERFKAQIRAGDEQSLAIQKLLKRYDTEINFVPQMESGINAISTVEFLYQVDNGGLLAETLDAIKEAYEVVGGRNTSAALMKALAWFIFKHGDANRSRVVEQLHDIGYAATDRKARTIQASMGGSLWMNYYRAIIESYNDRLAAKSKLQWQLRGAGRFTTRRLSEDERAT